MAGENDSTFECSEGNAFERTGCILSYNGTILHILINYILLLVNLTYCIMAVTNHTHDIEKAANLKRFALWALFFVAVFQVTLCLILGCSGISIVWCAMGGWIMSERRRVIDGSSSSSASETNAAATTTTTTHVHESTSLLSSRLQRLLKIGIWVIFLDTVAIVYYAIVAELITLVAHICALVLGAILSLLSIRLYDEPVHEVLEFSSQHQLLDEPVHEVLEGSASGSTSTGSQQQRSESST
jgi:hypothetical protein